MTIEEVTSKHLIDYCTRFYWEPIWYGNPNHDSPEHEDSPEIKKYGLSSFGFTKDKYESGCCFYMKETTNQDNGFVYLMFNREDEQDENVILESINKICSIDEWDLDDLLELMYQRNMVDDYDIDIIKIEEYILSKGWRMNHSTDEYSSYSAPVGEFGGRRDSVTLFPNSRKQTLESIMYCILEYEHKMNRCKLKQDILNQVATKKTQ